MRTKQALAIFCTATLLLAGCRNANPKEPTDPTSTQETLTGGDQSTKTTKEYSDKDLSQKMKEREENYLAQREEPLDEDDTMPLFGAFTNTVASSSSKDTDAAIDAAPMAEAMVTEEEGTVGFMPSDYDDIMGDFCTAEFSSIQENGFRSVQTSPFSTFAADVDTASYSELRRDTLTASTTGNELLSWLDKDAIRIEEMVNYFSYDYPEPQETNMFGVRSELAPCPWNEDTKILMVGVKAKEAEPPKGRNIVLLIDTSGSMFGKTRLGYVQEAMNILLENMTSNDRISIVTYAGSSEILAAGLSGEKKDELKNIIDGLNAFGSTNGSDGINTAYDLAQENFIGNGVNRVILCTDGDLNVGVTSEAGLIDLIERQKERGVFLSVLGVGYTNYSDSRMEALADHGNGNYAYIDCLDEAKRVLDKEFTQTTQTVAKDVKFQLEFNPSKIKGYRQIGYENRTMAAEDFADDTKDGGEVGSGQTVTVLYEIVPVDSKYEVPGVESKYSKATPANSSDYLTVSIRYKKPDGDISLLEEYMVTEKNAMDDMSDDMSWAAGVAQTGMLLRESQFAGTSTFKDVKERLSHIPGAIDDDWRLEFLLMLSKYIGK